jgi:hypothetical protein
MRAIWFRRGGGVMLALGLSLPTARAQGPFPEPPPPPPSYEIGGKHRPMVMPTPIGTYVRAWEAVGRTRAREDRFVIYRCEWFNGTELGPYGRFHLEQMAQCMSASPDVILIQWFDNGPMDQLRRATVIAYLVGKGIHDAEVRVTIGHPQAEGLYGTEAVRIFQSRFGGTGAGGSNVLGDRSGVGGLSGEGSASMFGGASGFGTFGGYGSFGGGLR